MKPSASADANAKRHLEDENISKNYATWAARILKVDLWSRAGNGEAENGETDKREEEEKNIQIAIAT